MMVKSKNLKIWIVLELLTIIAVISSSYLSDNSTTVLLGLAMIKFLGVSFFFMELKNAHSFYKVGIVIFSVILFSILYLLY